LLTTVFKTEAGGTMSGLVDDLSIEPTARLSDDDFETGVASKWMDVVP
jgi:hypothetical protein